MSKKRAFAIIVVAAVIVAALVALNSIDVVELLRDLHGGDARPPTPKRERMHDCIKSCFGEGDVTGARSREFWAQGPPVWAPQIGMGSSQQLRSSQSAAQCAWVGTIIFSEKAR